MKSPARKRAEEYAAMAPAGATVTVTEEQWELLGVPRFIAQVTIKGAIDTMCITISSKTTGRTRASASCWFNSGSKSHDPKVRDITYRIKNIYVSQA